MLNVPYVLKLLIIVCIVVYNKIEIINYHVNVKMDTMIILENYHNAKNAMKIVLPGKNY